MYSFGKQSKAYLNGVAPRLAEVMEVAIADSPIDFSITSGLRTTKEQQALFAQGRTAKGSVVTEKDGVIRKSNHQAKADGFGHAVDFCPYINGSLAWNNTAAFIAIALHIKAKAKALGVAVRWGADWDGDGITKAQGDKDESFVDLPHIELL